MAFGFSKTALMEPFCHLLKPKSVFTWSPELQEAFVTARSEIVSLVEKGVSAFELGPWICLVTDWSRVGKG